VKRIFPSQDEFGMIINHLIKNRTWYFVPIDLKKIPPEDMGIPMASLDQWGRQSTGAVWMSTFEYKGRLRNKAQILWHELLVGIKILRHMSEYEQCKAMFGTDLTCLRRNREPLYKKIRLIKEDYDQVHLVVNWLLNNHTRMTALEFAQQ